MKKNKKIIKNKIMKNIKLAITSLLIPIVIIGLCLELINLKFGFQTAYLFNFFQKPIQIFLPVLVWNYLGLKLFNTPKYVGLMQWFTLGIWLFFGPFILLILRQFTNNYFMENHLEFSQLIIYTILFSSILFFTFPIFQFKFLTTKTN
jgi:hypothetical protein